MLAEAMSLFACAGVLVVVLYASGIWCCCLTIKYILNRQEPLKSRMRWISIFGILSIVAFLMGIHFQIRFMDLFERLAQQ